MTKIEEILENKYTEETIENVLRGNIDKSIPFPKNKLMVLELIKIEGNQLLFVGDKDDAVGTDKVLYRVTSDDTSSIEPEFSTTGEEKFNYIFWVRSDGLKGHCIEIHYIKTGYIEKLDDIDIAYGDDIISYVTQKGNKVENLDKIPSILYSWFAFNADSVLYLFIETFINGDQNFVIHGLSRQVDVNVNEDGKWVIHKITKKPFPSRYSDFISYKPVRCNKLQFVERSCAREVRESISSREALNGDTVLCLWKEYSSIEKRRAEDLKNKLGILKFDSAVPKKNGLTAIKLRPTEEQKDYLSGKDIILNFSFNIVNEPRRISFQSLDVETMTAVIWDENYDIKQGKEGQLEVNIDGDIAVWKRRDRARKWIHDTQSFLSLNLRFAMEGYASAMRQKQRREKPLSERTRSFIKKEFGIEDLTPDQKMAVDIALNTPDIAVIQGPPGTGKSTVVSVICQRLMEIAEKKGKCDKGKIIFVSAFQHDTVEHIASKIYTNGLPTIKIGKDEQGIKVEELFIKKMQDAIDDAIHRLSPKVNVSRVSKQLSDLKMLFKDENNEDEIKAKINSLIKPAYMSEDLYQRWVKFTRPINESSDGKEKLIAIVKGLRVDAVSYSDDGFKQVRKLLKSGLPINEEERKWLEEDAPTCDAEITEDFLHKLKELQEKYLIALRSDSNVVKGGVNDPLNNWIDDAIEEFNEKEKHSYEDKDTFLVATLETLREELFGNTQHIKEAIQQYAHSIAATNQYAGSKNLSDTKCENVILEEAARSNPLDLLIPMTRATERIIMVGDQFQLPHLLENDIVDEAVKDNYKLRKKYEESLFGIIFRNLEQAKPVRRITLKNQFRMHPVIGDFISKTYYNGQLSSKMVDVKKKLHKLELSWAKDKVVVSCDVPKRYGLEQCGRSKSRSCEARKVVELLQEIKSDKAFENLNVGIITFYSKQVDLICKEASKYGYTELDKDGTYHISPQYQITSDGREKLRIGSVDSFQGKEFDIVILSTVRSNTFERIDKNNSKVFGFLTLANRLNVALSRAQKLVITVGDMEMFEDEFAETYVKGLYEFNKLTLEKYGSRI